MPAPASRSTTAGRPASSTRPRPSALGEGRATSGCSAGPEVDPAAALGGARTSWRPRRRSTPTIPTTEPRLRAALRRLVDARRPATRPRRRSCQRGRPRPAALPGADDRRHRHEGQDDDLVARRGAPGGRSAPSGRARRQHRPAARRAPAGADADHRVVIELSELQLPTLSRGTTVAVYTNVTSDHLDRHGIARGVPARSSARLAELVDPAGALVLNADDPVVAGYAGLGDRPGRVLSGRRDRCRAGSASSTAGSSRPASRACRSPATGPGGRCRAGDGRIMPVGELAIPGRHNAEQRPGGGRVGAAVRRRTRRRSAGPRPALPRRRAPARDRGDDRRRPLRQRLAGAPSRTRSIAALRAFDAADRAHRRRPRQGRRPRRPPGRSSPSAPPRRSSSARAARRSRRCSGRPGSAGPSRPRTLEAAVDRAAVHRPRSPRRTSRADAIATVLLSPAAASFDMFVDYAARGRAFKDAVAEDGRSPHRSEDRP